MSIYGQFFKKRFLRLYIGYFIALLVVLIAKILAGYTVIFSTTGDLVFGGSDINPVFITPTSLILDLTCTWPLFTGNLGGIWPEGWFICAMMLLSLIYPFLRRLYSINKNYLYLIIILTTLARIFIIIFVNADYAYYFPFSWTAEFSVGIIVGNHVGEKGGPAPPSASYKSIIINLAARIWPLYLFHVAAIVFMPNYASPMDFFVTVLVIFALTEIFYRILKGINILLGFERKKVRPTNDFIKNG